MEEKEMKAQEEVNDKDMPETAGNDKSTEAGAKTDSGGTKIDNEDSRDDNVNTEADNKKPETENKSPEAENKMSAIQQIKASASEEDGKPSQTLSLRGLLGGDMLSTNFMRRQVWLILLIMVFIIVYVAFRYQCQQDMIAIDKLEKDLKDMKYKALSTSSTLTEKSRESHIIDILKTSKDSLLKPSDQPPYIINVPEE